MKLVKESYIKPLGQMNAYPDSRKYSDPCLESQKAFTKRLPLMNAYYEKCKR